MRSRLLARPACGRADFCGQLVDDSEIAPRSYDDALSELLKSLGKPREKRAGPSSPLDAVLDLCDPEPITLLDHAYEAAYFGKNEAARKLMHAALREEDYSEDRAIVARLYRDWASGSYDHGFTMLDEGEPREEVLAHWKETLRLYPETIYVDSLRR